MKRNLLYNFLLILMLEMFSYIILSLFQTSSFLNPQSRHHTYRTFSDNNFHYNPFTTFSGEHPLEIRKKINYFENLKGNNKVLALTGGSFASELYTSTSLNKVQCPNSSRQLHIVNLAVPSAKQPQQLMTSALYNTNFDGFISIEGFNEISSFQTPACRPSYWSRHFTKYDNNYADSLLLSFIKSTYKMAYHLGEYSQIFKLIATSISRPLYKFSFRMNEEHARKVKKNCSYKVHNSIHDRWLDHLFTQHSYLNSSTTRLLTFIQPNLYVKNTKTFTPEELKLFKPVLDKEKVLINTSYIQALGEIKKKKLDTIYDLTQIFKNTQDTIYRDDCCHINKAGNDIVLEKILPIVLKTYCP